MQSTKWQQGCPLVNLLSDSYLCNLHFRAPKCAPSTNGTAQYIRHAKRRKCSPQALDPFRNIHVVKQGPRFTMKLDNDE